MKLVKAKGSRAGGVIYWAVELPVNTQERGDPVTEQRVSTTQGRGDATSMHGFGTTQGRGGAGVAESQCSCTTGGVLQLLPCRGQ
ncbi:hypothetical protein HN51_054710, partial [Arachis hypogaea]